MRMLIGLLALFLSGLLHSEQRGAVSGVTVSPAKAQTGTALAATVTGTNPCGAVHIDWGDGTAVTYPIVELPATQRHAYSKAGAYTPTARGMGNCDGQASARVQIDPAPAPAPAPPAQPARIKSVEVSPNPSKAPATVNIVVQGTGTCSYTLDFGDGNVEQRTASLPDQVRHAYPAANPRYSIVVKGQSGCEGLARRSLTVEAAPPASRPGRLSRVTVTPNPVAVRSQVTVAIEGNGTCPVTVDFGDGSDERLEAALPARVLHTFTRPGVYDVYAWAHEPCAGDDTIPVRVRGRRD